jgi:hypothetical protein
MAERVRYRYVDDDGVQRRVRVVLHRGFEGFVVRWTGPCSGCYESGEYGGNADNYPYDAKARCRIGAGCSECGFTGKRRRAEWVPFPDVAAAYFAAEERLWRRRERLLAFWSRNRRLVANG